MNDVKVHYNSLKPAQVQALAYTQGTDIHVGAGQEKHLPHEAWHVVQQKQGRVQATLQAKGIAINDDSGLEQEAAAMGAKAIQRRHSAQAAPNLTAQATGAGVMQRYQVSNTYAHAAGAASQTLFKSHGLRAGGGPHDPKELYRQETTRLGGGGLQNQDQTFRRPMPLAPRAWLNAGGAAAVGALPNLKISQNRNLAVENVSQPSVFFMDPVMIAPTNATLLAAGSGMRILATGGPPITVFPGTPNVNVLDQVTVATAAAPGVVANIAQHECHEVARLVTGNAALGPALNHTRLNPNSWAAPAIGHAYGFRSSFEDSGRNRNQMNAVKPLVQVDFENKMDDIVNDIGPIFDNLAQGLAMNFANIGRKARMMLPGWETHFEGVIAVDGRDRITMANYNRIAEIRFEKRRVFLDLYQTFAPFRAAFIADVMAHPAWTWLQVTSRMASFIGTGATNAAVPGLLAQITEFEAALNAQRDNLWYFEMYGRWGQSFHTKYKQYGRGSGGSTRTL